jgi:hypothetical protein
MAIPKGLLWRYLACLPLMVGVDYAIYHRLDSERVFYALYYAFGAPFLLSPSNWRRVQRDERVLKMAGQTTIVARRVAQWQSKGY